MKFLAARPRARSASLRLGAALGLVLTLSACATEAPGVAMRRMAFEADRFAASLFSVPGPEVRRLDAAPAPAARPARMLSRTISARDPRNGARIELKPRHIGGGVVEVRQNDGCVWRRGDWFAPSTSWRGCGDSASWRDGGAKVSGGAGLWPLRIGAEGRHQRRATSSTGRSYERETVCRVSDAVEVIRAGHAPTPAFVVDCVDGKRVRTTWWSPAEGPVAFRKTHEDKGVEEVWIVE